MDNPTAPELSSPTASPPAVLDPPPDVATSGLSPDTVTPKAVAPALAPLPDPTPNPAPIADAAPKPEPVADRTPKPAPVADRTPVPAPVTDPTPVPEPVTEPTPDPAPVTEPTPDPAPVTQPTPNPVPDTAVSTITHLPEHLLHKNRLQEYTQKSSLPLPSYQTFNEGSSHMPKFRSTVWVDGAQFTSPKTFLHRKAAEQDVANLALESILKRVKDEGCPLLHGDTVFCKSILNEFAVKMNLEKPTYNTVQSPGLLPVFVSSLVFNGASYTGDSGRNKKEAEQLAARIVILSLLGNSGSSKILYEIIKSKSKLYAALDMVKDPSHSQPYTVPVGVKAGPCSETTVNQEQEVSTGIVRDAVPVSAISPAASGMHAPHHNFKRSRPDPAPKPSPFPIAFVHPALEQPVSIELGSSSAKKRRKNKKKANKNKNDDAQFSTDAIPLNQASPCSVAQ